jgi:hypothetical protein
MKTAYLFKALGPDGGFADAPISLLAHAARTRRDEARPAPAQNLDALRLVSGVLLRT